MLSCDETISMSSLNLDSKVAGSSTSKAEKEILQLGLFSVFQFEPVRSTPELLWSGILCQSFGVLLVASDDEFTRIDYKSGSSIYGGFEREESNQAEEWLWVQGNIGNYRIQRHDLPSSGWQAFYDVVKRAVL